MHTTHVRPKLMLNITLQRSIYFNTPTPFKTTIITPSDFMFINHILNTPLHNSIHFIIIPFFMIENEPQENPNQQPSQPTHKVPLCTSCRLATNRCC